MFIHRSTKRQQGQGLVEYALILATVSIVAIIALSILGDQVAATFQETATALNSMSGTSGLTINDDDTGGSQPQDNDQQDDDQQDQQQEEEEEENDSTVICHKPGTRAEKTMTVNSHALGGHLGHGDTIGPCE